MISEGTPCADHVFCRHHLPRCPTSDGPAGPARRPDRVRDGRHCLVWCVNTRCSSNFARVGAYSSCTCLLYLPDPLSGRYTRLNKAGVIHPSPALSLVPHPINPLLFYALHQDGHVVTYSLDREDPPATFIPPWSSLFSPASASTSPPPATAESTGQQSSAEAAIAGMLIWRNLPVREGDKDKDRAKSAAGKNPVAVWKVHVGTGANPASMSERKKVEKPTSVAAAAAASHSMNGADGGKGLTAGSISPDGRLMALTGDDGGLRIIDLAGERSVHPNDSIWS